MLVFQDLSGRDPKKDAKPTTKPNVFAKKGGPAKASRGPPGALQGGLQRDFEGPSRCQAGASRRAVPACHLSQEHPGRPGTPVPGRAGKPHAAGTPRTPIFGHFGTAPAFSKSTAAAFFRDCCTF